MSFFKKHSKTNTKAMNTESEPAAATAAEATPINEQETVPEQTAQQPVTEGETTAAAAPVEESSDSKPLVFHSIEHLESYPMVKETKQFLDSFPITTSIKKTSLPIIEPILKFTESQSFLKLILENSDKLGDSTLNQIDWLLPVTKSLTFEEFYEDVSSPIIKTDKLIKDAIVSANDSIEKNLISPTKNSVKEFRSFYNKKVYDTHGKPLLRSSLDPIFKPINSKVENYTNEILPVGEKVSNEFSSEIERNLYLNLEFGKRSIPVINEAVVSTIKTPCNLTNHVFEVYNENLQKFSDVETQQDETKTSIDAINSSIKATINTSKELTDEVVNHTVEAWNKLFKKTESVSTPVLADSTIPAAVEVL